ncbi:hypothetical protein ACQJBY_046385 [Aegilops geniculata]
MSGCPPWMSLPKRGKVDHTCNEVPQIFLESGASLSIIEAEICNAAELGSGGQSGGFPLKPVCSKFALKLPVDGPCIFVKFLMMPL